VGSRRALRLDSLKGRESATVRRTRSSFYAGYSGVT
jgi:hypothetical protein